MDSQNPVSQPDLVPSPKPPFNWSIVLIGVVVLLVALLGGSVYQILSLRKEVDSLKAAAIPTPTPTPISVETGGGVVTPAPTNGQDVPIELTGIIKFSNLEGGCWYIGPTQIECSGDKCPLSDLPNYEIINIPAALKKDGIKAKFELEVQADVATTCQIGPAVKILDYQIIK